MRSLGRRLLLGMLLLVALTWAVGLPRLWHAHTAADAEHEHSSADSHASHHGHSHPHGHSHAHSHHSHGHHSHGDAHSHSHGPAHSHSHPPTVESEDDSNVKAASAQHATQWHLHMSLWGWNFTIWGSDVAPGSSRQAMAQQGGHSLKEPAHRLRDAADDGTVTVTVSAVDWDWLAHWDSGFMLLPLQRSVMELPFDPSRQFEALVDESPGSAGLQPPVPPPRAIL